MTASSFCSSSTAACRAFFFFLLLLSFSICSLSVSALDFEVGDSRGWKVPPSNDTRFYNQWASKNRFKVDDVLVFKYRKDSVMVVAEEDYDKCNSSHPIFFDNKGTTEVQLDRPGPFFFISGIEGHCLLGQKMIVKVLSNDDTPGSSPSPANGTVPTLSGSSGKSGAAAHGRGFSAFWSLFLLLVVPFFF